MSLNNPKLSGFLAQFRKLDVFRKVGENAFDADAVRHSQIGAALSLTTTLVLGYLFLGQFLNFLTPEVKTNYAVAKDQPATLGLFFGLNFSKIPCSAISVDYANVYGSYALDATTGSASSKQRKNRRKQRQKQKTDQQDAKDGVGYSPDGFKSNVRISKRGYFNELHSKDMASAASFVDGSGGGVGEVADPKWNCTSGHLTDPESVIPCINRDVFTTVIFTSHECTPCQAFIHDYVAALDPQAGGGNGVAAHLPLPPEPEGTTSTTSTPSSQHTTLNHRGAVEHSVLVADCKDPLLHDVCLRHGVVAVPTIYTSVRPCLVNECLTVYVSRLNFNLHFNLHFNLNFNLNCNSNSNSNSNSIPLGFQVWSCFVGGVWILVTLVILVMVNGGKRGMDDLLLLRVAVF